MIKFQNMMAEAKRAEQSGVFVTVEAYEVLKDKFLFSSSITLLFFLFLFDIIEEILDTPCGHLFKLKPV